MDINTTWSVVANEAGNELVTEEVLYTGLTKAVALATAKGMVQGYLRAMDGKTYNYFIRKEA